MGVLCPVPDADGESCGQPAAFWDPVRGAVVCAYHRPPVSEALARAEWWLRFLDLMQPPGRRWLIGGRRAE